MKKIIEKLKTINLTLPLLGIVAAMGIIIVLLANYYGYIKVAGLQNWTRKTETASQPTTEKTEESKTTVEEPKTETVTPSTPTVTTPQASISLTATAYATGVKLTWTTANVDTSKGFKVLKSTAANPVYPGNYSAYVSRGTNSFAWEIKDGGTYHFRVCQYTGAACGVYSNNVKATAPYVVTENPKPSTDTNVLKSITLSLLKSEGANAKFTWSVDGSASNGFKLVWSKTTGPTYPRRDGDQATYYGSTAREGYVAAFETGTFDYYVRLCEYKNGACGITSNEIRVTLTK